MRSIIKTISFSCAVLFCTASASLFAQDLKIGPNEYFEARGLNILVYNNQFTGGFNDEKNSGLEIIQHGVRIAQGGAVRLSNTPEQWDLVPKTLDRVVDIENGIISLTMYFPDYDFSSRLEVKAKDKGVELSIHLDKPVPAELEGDAGFNLEFLPSQYWSKTYLVDGRPGRFSKYAVSNTIVRDNSEKVKQFKGFRTYDDRGTGMFVDPLPLASGKRIIMAQDDPERMIKITSDDADISIYDGRILAQNGWFVLRSLLPSGKTGKVLSWYIEPNRIKDWTRKPNIGFSQVGYTPAQQKIAVIELDKNDTVLKSASVYRIEEDGNVSCAFEGPVTVWGEYFKYNYAKFDFSEVNKPGFYYIQYGDQKTDDFTVANHVYDRITDATSDVWIPIHMNHMTVNEGYRIWHGEPFKEGYLQAPPSDHFDMHFQGENTDTKYKPYELIPGLNVGGFFDAGDFDIETNANIGVVQSLVSIWEYFKPMRDQTFVDENQRYVDLHRPDGKPDILQYIEHGALNLLAQAENIGHMATTLSTSVLDNYHHLGDAATITDGRHYDPSLKPYEVSEDGLSSGTPDDMWAFTNRNPASDQRAAQVFAQVARVMKGYNDELAERAIRESKRLSNEAAELLAKRQNGAFFGFGGSSAGTNLQLYVSTGEKSYLEEFEKQIWGSLDRNVNFSISTAMDAIPYMPDSYREKLRPYIAKYKEYVVSLEKNNPYGVPMNLGNWAGSGDVVSFGTVVATANRYFPDIIGKEHIYKAANYIFGCHPYHNYSLVATLDATRPKNVFYGNNRADFATIPGNLAPGLLFRQPDHFENYDDWPFLWGENEGTIAGNCSYLYFGYAFRNVVE